MWLGFGVIMMRCVVRNNVFLMLCVMKNIVLLVCVYMLSMSVCIVLCVIVLSVFIGLFISSMCGLFVSVCVMLICCCILFDSLYMCVCVWCLRLMSVSILCVCVLCLVFDMCVKCSLSVMLLSMLSYGSSVYFWNMMLWLVLGFVIGMLLICMLFVVGVMKLVM